MNNNWLIGFKNFIIGTMLTVFLWGLLGFILNLVMVFLSEWGLIE